MATPFDAIGNFLGGIIDNFWTDERQQNQNDWNMQMWEKNAQWNSPENQMKLMQQAGINPAFAAAGISGNPGYQAPVGSQVMPQSMGFNNFGTNMAKAFESRQQGNKTGTETEWLGRVNQAEIDKAQSEIMKNESLSHLNEEQKKVIRENLEMMKGKTAKEIEKMTEEMRQINAAVLNINALTEKISAETENVRQDTANKEAMHEQIEAGAENIKQDTQLKQQEEKTSKSLEDLNLNQISKMSAEIGLINTQKACEELRQEMIKADTNLTKSQIMKTLRESIEKDIDIYMKSHGFSESLAGTIARSITMGESQSLRISLDNIVTSYDLLLQQMETLGEPIKHPKLITPTMNDRMK